MTHPLELPNILKLIDAVIIPLLDKYDNTGGKEKEQIAQQLIEFDAIFKYHFPEAYEECRKLIKK